MVPNHQAVFQGCSPIYNLRDTENLCDWCQIIPGATSYVKELMEPKLRTYFSHMNMTIIGIIYKLWIPYLKLYVFYTIFSDIKLV